MHMEETLGFLEQRQLDAPSGRRVAVLDESGPAVLAC